ncbi:hypothetical protein AAU61_12105 [Desulfocarbo indianensis]|nr:hypothetical protein AAU61_12105 [Desulfocarbo indianensis]
MIPSMKPEFISRDQLLAAEGLAAILALALLCLAAALYPLEPVGQVASQGRADAPWLFLGLQELLRHLPALLAGVLIPCAALAFTAALPWLAGEGKQDPPHWRRAWRPAEYGAWFITVAWLGLTVYAAF